MIAVSHAAFFATKLIPASCEISLNVEIKLVSAQNSKLKSLWAQVIFD